MIATQNAGADTLFYQNIRHNSIFPDFYIRKFFYTRLQGRRDLFSRDVLMETDTRLRMRALLCIF